MKVIVSDWGDPICRNDRSEMRPDHSSRWEICSVSVVLRLLDETSSCLLYEGHPAADTMNECGCGELIDHPGNRYDICRKSDGVKVAVTEAPCRPGFQLIDPGNGDRSYYTLLDGKPGTTVLILLC